MISIVLPTYNGEKYIEESIKSILNQTEHDFELIIVNDCSTDKTESIIRYYMSKDIRIKYVKNEINRKLPASLNIGFSNAKGQYFTWTSDDNIFKNNALETMQIFLKNNTSIDLVYANYDIINENGNILEIGESQEDINIYAANIVGACFLYKRCVHEKLHGYNENKFLVEDYDFWIRAKIYYNFAHLDESLYLYRQHSNSLTSERKKEVVEKTNELLWENLKKRNLSDKEKIIIYKRLIEAYYYYYDKKMLKMALNKLSEISSYDYSTVDFSIRISKSINKEWIDILRKIYHILVPTKWRLGE